MAHSVTIVEMYSPHANKLIPFSGNDQVIAIVASDTRFYLHACQATERYWLV